MTRLEHADSSVFITFQTRTIQKTEYHWIQQEFKCRNKSPWESSPSLSKGLFSKSKGPDPFFQVGVLCSPEPSLSTSVMINRLQNVHQTLKIKHKSISDAFKSNGLEPNFLPVSRFPTNLQIIPCIIGATSERMRACTPYYPMGSICHRNLKCTLQF